MELLSQSALLVGITSFALGLSVLTRNVKNTLYIAFAAFCVMVSAWATFFFLEVLWGGGNYYRWHLLLNVWLGPFALTLVRILVRVESSLSRWLFRLSVVLGGVLTAVILSSLDRDPVWRQIIYYSPGVIVIQFLQLMWIDRVIRLGRPRPAKTPTVGFARRSLIYFGGLLVLSTSAMDHFSWLGGAAGWLIPTFGNLGLTVYLFFISQAVTQQRLLNFGAMVSRFGVLLAVALLLTGVYSMLFAWIQRSAALFFLNSFIVSFMLISLLEPIRRLVSYLTRLFVTKKQQRLEEIIREAQRALSVASDPSSTYAAIESATLQFLEPEWIALYVLRPEGVRFRRMRISPTATALTGSAEPPREIIAQHPLINYCQELHAKGRLPVALDQVLESEMDRSATRSRREELASLHEALRAFSANLLIPLFDGAQVLGFALLRAPRPPEPWGSNWGLLPIVYPYFDQAGRALRSMEIFARSREKERLAALGEMAAGLAHEIRNPLGAIRGAAQVLDPAAGRPDSAFLNIIIEEADRLNRVVTQFLDYSKPPMTDFRTIDLAQLAERTLDRMKPAMPPGVRLEFHAPPRPARVRGAAEPLMQVLINLVQNAAKALEGRGEGAIRVGVEPRAALEDMPPELDLYVEDNGKGIPAAHLEKLFIPFFTTSPGGTGLGLSISQKIVEAHRGRIEVATEEGRFTRFSVILPSEG